MALTREQWQKRRDKLAADLEYLRTRDEINEFELPGSPRARGSIDGTRVYGPGGLVPGLTLAQMESHIVGSLAHYQLVDSLVGCVIVAAEWRNEAKDEGWGESEGCYLTLSDGRTIRIGESGWGAVGIRIDEVPRVGDPRGPATP